jgi:serine/threonine-protein kinase RsbW
MLVRQAIDGAARELGGTPKALADIKLAVTEACANVVKHAYGGQPGTLRVRVVYDSGSMRIFVRDFGAWMPQVQGGRDGIDGMGIPLMEAVTSECEVTKLDPGTEVMLAFELDSPPDQPAE